MGFTVGIAGLGLMGGSLAKAFHAQEDIRVLGYDRDESVISRAKLQNATDGCLTKENISECDYIFIALYPNAVIDFVEKNAPLIGKNTVVVDCAGTKRSVCERCFKTAARYGFRFIGGHPMAGTQFSGFRYSRASMFDKANMILVPDKDEKIETLEALKALLVKAGFKGITITTAEQHDEIIAFTSQLAHVVSNAYVKSPNAKVHSGFSAGSYRDLTRVARLNAGMWTELFLENGDNLANEIDCIVSELEKYSDAIKKNDAERLCSLLEEGSRLKESIG